MAERQLNFEIENDYFRRVWWNPVLGGSGESRWWKVAKVRETGPNRDIEVGMVREDGSRGWPYDYFWVRLNRKGMPRGFRRKLPAATPAPTEEEESQ